VIIQILILGLLVSGLNASVRSANKKLSAAAWDVINTRCVRCHGGDITPDVSGVGNLDLRTRSSILAGGNRGPAMTPRVPNTSLIYLFVSLWTKNTPLFSSYPGLISFPPSVAQVTDLNNLDARTQSLGLGLPVLMPPFNPLDVTEVNTIRLWISAGAP